MTKRLTHTFPRQVRRERACVEREAEAIRGNRGPPAGPRTSGKGSGIGKGVWPAPVICRRREVEVTLRSAEALWHNTLQKRPKRERGTCLVHAASASPGEPAGGL